MTDRYFPDLEENLEWNLVRREVLTNPGPKEGEFYPLPPRSYLIQNSHLVAVGITSPRKRQNWYTGGWASQNLLLVPSSTSGYTGMQSSNRWLAINTLTLLQFDKLMASWYLKISFPSWFETVNLEVWRYDGRDRAWYDPQS